MREKEFDKLVDEVTERVSLRILSADWTCYKCGESSSILGRIEKLEQEAAKRIPTAEPKTGRWEKMEARGCVYRCNQCGNFLDFDGVNVGRGDANYCPNCGARMEVNTEG